MQCASFSQSIASLCNGGSLSWFLPKLPRLIQPICFLYHQISLMAQGHAVSDWYRQLLLVCLSYTVHNRNAFYKCLSAQPHLFYYWVLSHFCYSSPQDYVVIAVEYFLNLLSINSSAQFFLSGALPPSQYWKYLLIQTIAPRTNFKNQWQYFSQFKHPLLGQWIGSCSEFPTELAALSQFPMSFSLTRQSVWRLLTSSDKL